MRRLFLLDGWPRSRAPGAPGSRVAQVSRGSRPGDFPRRSLPQCALNHRAKATIVSIHSACFGLDLRLSGDGTRSIESVERAQVEITGENSVPTLTLTYPGLEPRETWATRPRDTFQLLGCRRYGSWILIIFHFGKLVVTFVLREALSSGFDSS